jgi:hypothetical protein
MILLSSDWSKGRSAIYIWHVKFVSIYWATAMKQSLSLVHLYFSWVHASTHSSMVIIGWLHLWQVHPSILINYGKHHSSKITCCYSWHSYIHHPTSSIDETRQIFGQVFMRLCHYSTDTSPHNGIGHIITRHRQGEGNKIVQEDEDWRTHDWTPMRWKSSFSLIKHR